MIYSLIDLHCTDQLHAKFVNLGQKKKLKGNIFQEINTENSCWMLPKCVIIASISTNQKIWKKLNYFYFLYCYRYLTVFWRMSQILEIYSRKKCSWWSAYKSHAKCCWVYDSSRDSGCLYDSSTDSDIAILLKSHS